MKIPMTRDQRSILVARAQGRRSGRRAAAGDAQVRIFHFPDSVITSQLVQIIDFSRIKINGADCIIVSCHKFDL